jgi:hypothetical protein
MKIALIGAAAVAAAAFATPAMAQAVIEDPGYCAQFYPNANCQNLGPGNPYTDSGYRRDWYAMMPSLATQSAEADAYRYHGGPKSND